MIAIAITKTYSILFGRGFTFIFKNSMGRGNSQTCSCVFTAIKSLAFCGKPVWAWLNSQTCPWMHGTIGTQTFLGSQLGQGETTIPTLCVCRLPSEILASHRQPACAGRIRQKCPCVPPATGEYQCNHAGWEKKQPCHHSSMATGEASL